MPYGHAILPPDSLWCCMCLTDLGDEFEQLGRGESGRAAVWSLAGTVCMVGCKSELDSSSLSLSDLASALLIITASYGGADTGLRVGLWDTWFSTRPSAV